MPTHSDLTEMVPVQATDTYFKDDKGQSEHIDDVAQLEQPTHDTKPPTGLRRLLRRDPPRDFLQDVAQLNNEDLDQAEVKRVERKIQLLIVPTLLICYIFYCEAAASQSLATHSPYFAAQTSTRRPSLTPPSLR